MDLSPGLVIAGRYRVDARVGAGGMGEVWAGEHVAIGVKVAIKTLLAPAKLSHEVVARFKREAYLSGRIRSDFVARVLDFVTDDKLGLVIVMDYIEGDSLAKLVGVKRLTVEETIDLGADVAGALCDLHRAHVVHRDLKPGNIILQPVHGGRKRAVVVDFGVSRMISAGDDEETITGITRANMAVGTVEYMAPEQILNSRDVTGGSDCYALGAILFRSVAGHHVYGEIYDNELAHTKLTQDAPGLDTGRKDRVAKGLEAAVARALKRRLSERYGKADEMLADFTALRELMRVTAVEMADSTTTVDGPLEAPVRAPAPPPSIPQPPTSQDTGPSSRDAALAAPPLTSVSTSTAIETSRRAETRLPAGVSRGVTAVAVVAALVGGAFSGAILTQRRLAASAAESSALASPAPETPAPPAASPSASAVAAEAAAATATAAPTATAEIDLGELDPAPARRPRAGPAPGTGPSSAPWIPPVDRATGAITGAPTAAKAPGKPTAVSKPSGPPVERIDF